MIRSGPNAEMRIGNALPLEKITLGSTIHNIELTAGKVASCEKRRNIGAMVAKESGFGHVRLPSGEVRMIPLRCYATIGQVGNTDHGKHQLGQSGSESLAGPAAVGPRCGDEPSRSSDGRR